jgi:hypothetical protein
MCVWVAAGVGLDRAAAAADGVRHRHRHRLADPTDGDRHATRDAVRAGLGDEEFTSAWRAGRAAPIGLIIDQALELVPSAA